MYLRALYMHDVMPKVVAIAVSTVITMLITLLQMLFLLFIVISFLVCVKFRAKSAENYCLSCFSLVGTPVYHEELIPGRCTQRPYFLLIVQR
jgi:hypothetical protein